MNNKKKLLITISIIIIIIFFFLIIIINTNKNNSRNNNDSTNQINLTDQQEDKVLIYLYKKYGYNSDKYEIKIELKNNNYIATITSFETKEVKTLEIKEKDLDKKLEKAKTETHKVIVTANSK